MNNGRSIGVLTNAIIGNTIDSFKLVVKVCEMKRWTSTVLILSFLTIVLVSCVAVLLIVGQRPEDDDYDVPLHPISNSSSYPSSSTKSSRRGRSSAGGDEAHDEYHDEHDPKQLYHDHQPQLHEHRHNYRRRFTDAIKGVFSDLINNNKTKNSFTSSSSQSSPKSLSSPIFEEILPRHPTADKESSENNSSRLKRQLDFGSSSSEEKTNEGRNDSQEKYRTTQPSAKKYIPPSRRPFLRVIKTGGVSTTNQAPASSSSSTSPSPQISSSSEEIASSSEEPRRGQYRKNIRRFRPNSRQQPKLQSLSSKEKYDVSQEDQDAPRSRKNFTLEVVQVERKVVRKEDGNIPPLFKKGNFNIEPRLLKVTKKEDANRPQVVYKTDPRINAAPANRASVKKSPPRNSPVSSEVSKEIASAEASVDRGGDSSEEKKAVVVNLQQQIPYNSDQELSEEDLKDYHDGHSTFGSKGNFTHTIISRNVGGFVPNESGENVSKRRKSDRRIVIEKGKVTERYPEDELVENPNPEIYSVPGGRSSSTENYPPKQEAFPFTRTKKKGLGIGTRGASKEGQDNDRTSPAIPSSLEELYRKGHPGVVPAPKKGAHQRHPFSERYGEAVAYSSPFRYDPLVDDPPLKFDPESDRFYGEPVPDNRERVAQSNSPVEVENRDSPEEPQNEGFFRPKKRGSEEGIEKSAEDDRSSSREAPPKNGPNNDRFHYGRAYNPPDFTAEYDTEPTGNTRDNEEDNFDFVGLEDNFGPSRDTEGADAGGVDNDFFKFPDDLGPIGSGPAGPGGESTFRGRGSDERTDDNERRRSSNDEEDRGAGDRNDSPDYDEGNRRREEKPVKRPPPPPRQARGRNRDSDYEANNDYGFGPPAGGRGDVEDDEGHPGVYDTNFIHTLKQFDEEIKKLQDAEREKLLKSTALPDNDQERSTEQDRPAAPRATTNGYSKEPPLIITSPGPIQPSFDAPPDDGPSTPGSRLDNVGATIHVSAENDEDNEDVTEPNPFFSSSREPTESAEEFGDTTLPNRSIGAEEEEDAPTTAGFEVNDYSTERSGEVEEVKKKKK